MALKRKKSGSKLDACIYSDGIICETRVGCGKCGWNPIVDRARKARKPVWKESVWIDKNHIDPPKFVMGLDLAAMKRSGDG